MDEVDWKQYKAALATWPRDVLLKERARLKAIARNWQEVYEQYGIGDQYMVMAADKLKLVEDRLADLDRAANRLYPARYNRKRVKVDL